MTTIFVSGHGGHHSSVAELAVGCGFRVVALDAICETTEYANGWGLSSGASHRHACFHREAPNFPRSPALVSPSGYVSSNADIASGSQIHPGAIVRTHTTLGSDVVVNSGAIVEHHVHLGDGTFVGPGAVILGRVWVGDCALIGAGSTVLPGVSVGRLARVGAGSVVTRDLEPGATVAGVPARPLM